MLRSNASLHVKNYGITRMSIFVYGALIVAANLYPLTATHPPIVHQANIVTAQVIVQRTTIVRVPPITPDIILTQPTRWKEKGGPDCIKRSAIAAAMISSPTTLDIIVRGGTRYRVKLSKSCQAIDFYSDFYVKATPDGQVCRARDSIYSRAGGECGIDKFKSLIRAK